mmetsp:Transcript_152460/g.270495  ORF Transcript_152460/g.270495 Transcript_152460/m.270495 type:complete len:216 (+) Transcript_152460:18-665(+)
MNCCKDVVEHQEADRAQNILIKAFDRMVNEKVPPNGSCTACIASLDCRDGALQIANLGDSGALLVRAGGVCMLATEEQVHGFNCPYQLMIPPRTHGKTSGLQGDAASSSTEYFVDTMEGDVLILGTDGLFDNVFRQIILNVTGRMRSASPAEIADVLLEIAHSKSTSSESSPFQEVCARAGIAWIGGKRDDITVVVARVHSQRQAALHVPVAEPA